MTRFLIAAPSSGSGKTVITLGLLRAFKNRGVNVVSAKVGPDYIDPAFHRAATGAECVNLDPWAMDSQRLAALSHQFFGDADLVVVEGMMGLFDGAADGAGSAADLACMLNLPVVLVVDAARMSYSVAALVNGFRHHMAGLPFAGVILNRVGSDRHATMLRRALEAVDVEVLGLVPSDSRLELPSRHLGLVQASEHTNLETFLQVTAELLEQHCDLARLADLEVERNEITSGAHGLPPLGQSVAVAKDVAFTFSYAHMLDDWQRAGAALSFFSPLADEAPDEGADAVFLPGGYPELHAGRLSAAKNFLAGLERTQDRGALIYGECGGYMVLGEGITDAEGKKHAMAGLLKLETSFEIRKRHLGYRRLRADGFALGNDLTAHEFHYTQAIREDGVPLFSVSDALANNLGKAGLREGNVMGSYMHIIDRAS